MTMEFSHTSVLLKETIENLKIKPDGIYVDGTLVGAGHSSHICERLSATVRLIGIDQDEAAIAAAGNAWNHIRTRSRLSAAIIAIWFRVLPKSESPG